MTRKQFSALTVHVYTASGFLWALLVLKGVISGDYAMASIWMLIALAVDSTDGYLARKLKVKQGLPSIDGRKLDDIVDFLNYTFLPIFMILHAGWFPPPALLWGMIPVVTSAFAFSHVGAKNEETGYFLGFPSYWNIFAIYVFLWLSRIEADWLTVFSAVFFSLLSLLPVKFVYPSRAREWKYFYLWGGVVWILLLFWILVSTEKESMWPVYLSLVYPAAYLVSPFHFWTRHR